MSTTDTISVNPGKSTLAKTNSDLAKKIFRSSILHEEDKKSISSLDLLMPTSQSGVLALKKYFVPLRSLFAALLIINGLMLVQSPGAGLTWLAVVEFALGGLLALGLFSRISMALGTVFFAVVGILAMRSGVYDVNSFMLMFGCAAFSLLGAGKYSCDELLRKQFRRLAVRRERRESQNRVSYKAFRYS